MGKRKDELGMGITELMLMASIAVVVALAFSGMLVNAMKGQRGVQIRGNLQQFKTLLRLTLADAGSCKKALGGAIADGVTPVRVKQIDNPTQIWFQNGTRVAPDGFTITSVTIAPQSSNPYLALLQIAAEVSNPQGSLGSAKFPVMKIPLYVKRMGNTVEECGSEGAGSGGAAFFCGLQGGSMVDIGNTGVPQCFIPNQLSGMVVWIRNMVSDSPIVEGSPRHCQPSDNVSQVSAKSAAYCIHPNSSMAMPCCRSGFKRTRLGTFYSQTGVTGSDNVFACFFVAPNFCFNPGQNGCDCN